MNLLVISIIYTILNIYLIYLISNVILIIWCGNFFVFLLVWEKLWCLISQFVLFIYSSCYYSELIVFLIFNNVTFLPIFLCNINPRRNGMRFCCYLKYIYSLMELAISNLYKKLFIKIIVSFSYVILLGHIWNRNFDFMLVFGHAL